MDQQADANEQEVDDVCILQSRQFNVHGGNAHEVPKLGMEFDSEQHAFDYYSEYAHRVGFSVRKHHVKKRDGIVTRRTLCCSKQELKSEFKMRQTSPVLIANVEMLRHAVEVYTPKMFNMFQYEYTKAWDYSIHKVSKSENVSDYKVVFGGKGREHLVKFEAETTTVQCSCMKVNFVGILCRHALKVLDKKNIKRIPPQYILKRWTKDAKDAIVSDYRGAQGTSNNGRGSQQKGLKIGRQNEHQEEHPEKEDEIFTDVYSKVNDEHDIADDTLPLQSQYPLISRESQERSNNYVIPSININSGPKIWACHHMSFTELLQMGIFVIIELLHPAQSKVHNLQERVLALAQKQAVLSAARNLPDHGRGLPSEYFCDTNPVEQVNNPVDQLAPPENK
ncbi:hypothetical protein RJ640_001030 [Escallonia rubra]|uniref:Protein FAR1-RELATED SEQUENCE n=1 Tax=Escallonia rubra TaxID=112253 RepID=A0AA88QKA7_9ASTE|nr:hypothetical protein RJ640_001030 [Escallonia rubra]